jgi:hypothetical protein
MLDLKRTGHLKTYILQKYPGLDPKKFDIVKVGVRIYLYYVGHDGNLHRAVVFKGCLPTVEGIGALKRQLDSLIEVAIQKWQNVNN